MTGTGSKSERSVVLERPSPSAIVIRLMREERRNTLSEQMLEELKMSLMEIAANPPRAVIVTGKGQAFCAGGEIAEFMGMRESPHAISRGYVGQILEIFGRLRALPCPTIAAINGHAMGGGLELALNCDFRIAAKDVMLGLPEVQLGIVAAGAGVQQLHRIVGRAKALEMLLLGTKLSATKACEIGLVTSVCTSDDLEPRALEYVERLMRCAPEAVAETKRAVYQSESLDIDSADQVATSALHIAVSSPDFTEGITAFTEKRLASFGALPAAIWPAKRGEAK